MNERSKKVLWTFENLEKLQKLHAAFKDDTEIDLSFDKFAESLFVLSEAYGQNLAETTYAARGWVP